MALIANDLLTDVAFALVSPAVNTTLTAAVVNVSGVGGGKTVVPVSMTNIYVGALLVVGSGPSREAVIVTATSATSFTAVFNNAHAAGEPVVGATFPEGYPDNPLFTQSEMLAYLVQVQNDFLLKTRLAVNVVQQGTTAGVRFYSAPLDAIRIERIAILQSGAVNDLYNVAQDDLDLEDSTWPTIAGQPTAWFQDETPGAQQFGLRELPQTTYTLEIWYSQRGPNSLNVDSTLVVPDVYAHYLKYGVLAHCYAKDGEQRDPMREEYCRKRFELGVMLTLKFLDLVEANQKKGDVSTFTPMQVPAQ